MTTTLTPEQRLGLVDKELQALKNCFVEAISQLQQDPHIDGSFYERMENIDDRLKELRRDLRSDDLDKAQTSEFHAALWEIKDILDEQGGSYDLDVLDRLLVGIERIRHVVRDALDEHVAGVPDDAALAFAELREWLPNTSVGMLAELVGVDRRTPSRWTKAPQPASRRLQLVANLVAVLRHSWSEEGIIAWFQRPRRSLEGRKPILVLEDPLAEERLMSEARSGRSQDAT